MERRTLELVTGIFVVIGIVCLAYLSIKLGKLEVIGGDYYNLTAKFFSASGLKAGAPVEIAGVQVGRVQNIALEDYQAAVTVAIRQGIEVYSDAIASIKTRGIIGEKFVEVSPGGAGKALEAGATIRDTESGIDFEELVRQFVHGQVE